MNWMRAPFLRRAAAAVAVSMLGAAPWAHAGPTAYVSSERDDALTVIDLDTLAVKGTVPTCKRGRHLQRTPDGNLMLACTDSGVADVIDPSRGASVRRLPLGDDPEAFDLSPDGRTLYVSSEDAGELLFIDVASGKPKRAVKVGLEPEGVKVAPDGKTVYVTSEVANMVHAIDTTTGQVVRNIPVCKRPRRMAITPDGTQLWVTCELDAAVAIVSLPAHTVAATLRFEVPGIRASDITPVGIEMTRDGKQAFVALGRANRVAFVDVANRRTTGLVLVGKRAWNLALDAAQRRLLVVNGLSDDLTVIDVPQAKAVKTLPVGRVPYGVVIVE